MLPWYIERVLINCFKLHEITNLSYLNCISECKNGFSLVKNPKALRLYKINHSNM
jgi:hypothetical protein